MIKTTTTPLTAQTTTQDESLKKRKLNPSVCEPSDETIQNILNYSKALAVSHSANTGTVTNVMN